MNCLYIADMRIVEAILIVCVYSEVRHVCAVTRLGHQVRTVSHEVIAPVIKGGVMGVTRSNTGGGSCERKIPWCQRYKFKQKCLK